MYKQGLIRQGLGPHYKRKERACKPQGVEQASQAICQDLPNDAEEHYWSFVHSPRSIPTDYRRCMSCDRIDASEALTASNIEARVDELNSIDWRMVGGNRDTEEYWDSFKEGRINSLKEGKDI